jgi:anti-sigma factor RsiW
MARHEEFLELCAVSVSGELTDDERKKLDEHLTGCPSCRTVFDQYQKTAAVVLSRLGTELPHPIRSTESSWSESRAEAAFFERLKAEDHREQSRDLAPTVPSVPRHRSAGYVAPPARWKPFGMLYAAGILLFVSLAICAYRIGERRGVETATAGSAPSGGNLESTKSELSDAGHDRKVLFAEIAVRDKAIAELKQQIAREGTERDARAGKDIQARAAIGATKDGKLPDGQNGTSVTTRVEQLQRQLESQEKERAEQAARAGGLEAKVAELAKQLQSREDETARQSGTLRERDDLLEQRDKTIARQQELLAHDRDIRDLMSARDLYIAEVYDVAKTGETNKPYGRVFYTKGKSLLFYAYDLDQQAGLKKVSTFQAWGRRVTSQEQALSLGILYEDSVANKRWVVKSEDAKALEQIDAVFVTVEPNGGSQRPSGKPLLFAYLRIHPNHP